MHTADFDYPLPPELIAQSPAATRDGSRLMVMHRAKSLTEHRQFRDLPDYLRAGDVLVLNNSRVIRARLHGHKPASGGQVELLLVEEVATNEWWTLLRPGKRVRVGTEIQLLTNAGAASTVRASVMEKNIEGHCRVRFTNTPNIFDELETHGEIPLPPYIARTAGADDDARYQTVFSQPAGSVAAPTAGLHFTPQLLDELRARGVQIQFVTLHVGLGTFSPVKTENLSDHVMHEERFELPAATASAISTAKREGRRVIAVGTTTVRVLETAAALSALNSQLSTLRSRTRIFIHPPFQFRLVDALLTNFHLPQSTLLMLVSAFASPGELRGRELMLATYAEAVRERYRFFSYGDAMLIL
ncbi:MAG: tRNA preQ1(34) S-adenosylmethionine ribosyltransferase-isomerase QueA [Verrucomicrobia bacterium]|nr:tRNA preQ1(34) S-adenosylmethionine ribosyltransferase-isomerase QueA [Verrucomicrobiota bacterium]